MTTVSEDFRDIHHRLVALRDRTGTGEESDRHLTRSIRQLGKAAIDWGLQPDRDPPPPDRDPPPPDRDPPPPDRMKVITATGGDAIFTGEDVSLQNTMVLGGYRSCLMGPMGINKRVSVSLDNCVFASLDPNGPPGWDGTGTFWASRMYGIGDANVRELQVKNLFGKAVGGPPIWPTNEGHGLYWTLSPHDLAQYVFEGCTFDNMGGHAIYLTTASCDSDALNTARCGNAPQPEEGGRIVIRNCKIHNTDQSPARGAYAISLPDTYCETIIDQCDVVMDGPVYYKNGQPMNSRALLMAEGHCPSVLVKDSYFFAKPPSDRTAQIWMEGPETIELTGSEFDCPQISINHPYGDQPDTLKTKVLKISRCTGTADVLWQGELIGKIGELNGVWTADA